MRLMHSVSGDIRLVRSYLLESFGHVQNFERTPPDLVLQISRLSEGSTGQIFATSSVIYQIKMGGL